MDDRGSRHIIPRCRPRGCVISRSVTMSAEPSAPTPPPPYSLSDPRSHRLKDCFTLLLNKQVQIQTLFDVVAEKLQQLGSHHPLIEEWAALRQVSSATGAGMTFTAHTGVVTAQFTVPQTDVPELSRAGRTMRRLSCL